LRSQEGGVRWHYASILVLAALGCAAAAERRARVTDRPVRIVALGDSTTASAKDWAPEIQEVYADCLPRRLRSSGIEVDVDNAGIGDTTTRDAVERLDRDVRSHRPDIVIVQFGINDSWIDVDLGSTQPRLTRAEFRNNLRAIIRILKADGARVVLMTPNPMRWSDPYYIEAFEQHPGLLDTSDDQGINQLLQQYADDVRTVARSERAPLVDVYRAFEAYGREPGHSVNDLLLAGDGIHPNQSGQALVCRLLAEKLVKKVLRAAAGPAGAPQHLELLRRFVAER
jgi:lysophospholipase L1-like esterase